MAGHSVNAPFQLLTYARKSARYRNLFNSKQAEASAWMLESARYRHLFNSCPGGAVQNLALTGRFPQPFQRLACWYGVRPCANGLFSATFCTVQLFNC